MNRNVYRIKNQSRIKNYLSKLLVFAMVFTAVIGGFSDTAYGQMEIGDIEEQIVGNDQYETAYQVAKFNDPNPNTVVIVRGDKIDGVPQVIDGLTASGIAGMENASILLVEQGRIPAATKKALQDLNPQNVVIVGGPAAVSSSVHHEIYNMGISTKRTYGDNRYETAAETAKEMGTAKDNTAIIVDGRAVVDSLVAGPLAHKGYPILMINNAQGSVPEVTRSALRELGIQKVIIVGGTAVVSERIERELHSLSGITVEKRYGGRDRVDTSLLLGDHKDFSNARSVSLINGSEYIDAVAASSLGAPIIYYNERHGITDGIEGFIREKGNVKLIGATPVIEYTQHETREWPVPGYTRISSPYGVRVHPISGNTSMHIGMDIPAPGGAPIVAAQSGTVTVSHYGPSYGNWVEINHGNGITTRYAHNSSNLVRVGDRVETGQVIALIGTTGSSTGNHLHFEVRRNNKHFDPLPWLQGR